MLDRSMLDRSMLDRSVLDRSMLDRCAGQEYAGQVCWTGVCWTGVCWTGVCWTGVCWTGVCWTGVCWTQVCDLNTAPKSQSSFPIYRKPAIQLYWTAISVQRRLLLSQNTLTQTLIKDSQCIHVYEGCCTKHSYYGSENTYIPPCTYITIHKCHHINEHYYTCTYINRHPILIHSNCTNAPYEDMYPDWWWHLRDNTDVPILILYTYLVCIS